MRAAAQVCPGHLAVAPHVVVHGELALADLDRAAVVGRSAALVVDQFQLERLAGLFVQGLLVADRAADETLTLLDDRLHLLLDGLEVVGAERGGLEVVVEAVDDGRADAELGLGEDLLQSLGGDVRCGVPDDGQAFVRRHQDGADLVAVVDKGGQIDGGSVDCHGDDAAIVAEQIKTGSALLHHLCFGGLITGDADVDRHGKSFRRHTWPPDCVWRARCVPLPILPESAAARNRGSSPGLPGACGGNDRAAPWSQTWRCLAHSQSRRLKEMNSVTEMTTIKLTDSHRPYGWLNPK